ncbi:MAG: 4-hydroxy-tetrahydrodipicolinate reductase [Bacteroidota bacterium]
MRLLIYGYGAMGKLLCESIEDNPNLELIGAIEPRIQVEKEKVYQSLSSIGGAFDVLIDFSHPSNVLDILEHCKKHQKPVVICTTGFDEVADRAIQESSQQIPILLASNTSQGINLMHQLLRKAVQALAADFDIEIVEKHHNKKLDSPSGTANSLLETVQNSLPNRRSVEYGRNSMKKREQQEIGMHSLRGGTIVGEHSVIFAGEDEIIEIKHIAASKKVFAKGAIRAAQFLVKQEASLYDMEDAVSW